MAYVLTTCQTTFSVIPSPQTVPDRHTHLNNLPLVMLAAWNQSSRNRFTHFGTGTVRMCPHFPIFVSCRNCLQNGYSRECRILWGVSVMDHADHSRLFGSWTIP